MAQVEQRWELHSLVDWLREDKTNHDHIRLAGLELETINVQNTMLYQSATQGLILEHFETNEEYEYTGRTGFTIRLRFNGDYKWSLVNHGNLVLYCYIRW